MVDHILANQYAMMLYEIIGHFQYKVSDMSNLDDKEQEFIMRAYSSLGRFIFGDIDQSSEG